jgi:hypothetical protein
MHTHAAVACMCVHTQQLTTSCCELVEIWRPVLGGHYQVVLMRVKAQAISALLEALEISQGQDVLCLPALS